MNDPSLTSRASPFCMLVATAWMDSSVYWICSRRNLVSVSAVSIAVVMSLSVSGSVVFWHMAVWMSVQ